MDRVIRTRHIILPGSRPAPLPNLGSAGSAGHTTLLWRWINVRDVDTTSQQRRVRRLRWATVPRDIYSIPEIACITFQLAKYQ